MGLPTRVSKDAIDHPLELMNARSGSDSDGTIVDIVIGTSDDQIAITPGNLVKQWSQQERNYFHYQTDQPIINFYGLVSADYEVKKDRWTSAKTVSKAVDLEIYHHHKHNYNLDRMMAAMKASLTYYSTNFSPYPYQTLRIMEFPRYAEFAQSFPGTIPFSEALGFVLNIDDSQDVDMVFFITAHEIAHQWFGMQVEAANVQGQHFILETLSQYAALMVLKAHYPEEKVVQFLALQNEMYERKRKETLSEPPLALVAHEDFVYYNKGALAMFEFQQLVGEERVNLALQRFIQDWHSRHGSKKQELNRYPTTQDLLTYFRKVTPNDMQHKIQVLFERTQYDNLERNP